MGGTGAACQACPTGFQTSPFTSDYANSSAACTYCAPGFGNDTCAPCPVNTSSVGGATPQSPRPACTRCSDGYAFLSVDSPCGERRRRQRRRRAGSAAVLTAPSAARLARPLGRARVLLDSDVLVPAWWRIMHALRTNRRARPPCRLRTRPWRIELRSLPCW